MADSDSRGSASDAGAEPSALGVDWCNGSWLGVKRVDGAFAVPPEAEISELVRTHAEDVDRVLIDVPIGLFSAADGRARADDEELVRDCDSLARTILGARHSSVFNPPAREAIEEAMDEISYDTVSARNREITGKGLQQQAYHIAECIHQVDQLLDDADGSDLGLESPKETVLEAHPEVCFQALATDPERADDHEAGLQHSKKTVAGLAERLAALGGYVEEPWTEFGTLCEAVREAHPERDADVDDLLDAMALAVTGCAPDEDLEFLPPDPPEDELDLPMQMGYRRSAAFGVAEEWADSEAGSEAGT